jgi:hypothetical protein
MKPRLPKRRRHKKAGATLILHGSDAFIFSLMILQDSHIAGILHLNNYYILFSWL